MATSAKVELAEEPIDSATIIEPEQLRPQEEEGAILPLSDTDSDVAAQVFAVPELLDNILCNLPLINIVGVMRVNSTFRDLVETSLPLRRKTFMEPSTTMDFATAEEDKLVRDRSPHSKLLPCINPLAIGVMKQLGLVQT